MKEFVFESKQKSVLMGLMALGVVCLGITFVMDTEPYHVRFWSNFLHNSVFFTGISFAALFLIAAHTTAYSGWHTAFKRIWEAYSLFLIIGIVLMLVVAGGLWAGYHELYHWNDAKTVAADKILKGKSGFLNKMWYTFGTLIVVGIWIWFAQRFRALSVQEDEDGASNNYRLYRRIKVLAAGFLPIAGFSSAAMIWQWVMSVDSHWYSTLYAWYCTASWVVSMVALTILTLIYLKSKGYFTWVTVEHLHDLGKYMFAFSVFWTYLWFSQFMLIWYANVGEETIYFYERMHNYPALYWGNFIINFLVPFFVLMRNDTKRKYGSLVFIAVLVLFGHWIDFFQMIKPGVLHTAHELHAQHMGGAAHGDATTKHSDATVHAVETAKAAGEHVEKAIDNVHNAVADATHGTLAHATEKVAESGEHGDGGHNEVLHAAEGHGEEHHAGGEFKMGFTVPGLAEVGTFLGFLALFFYFVFMQLEKASLLAKNDPYIQESLNHHVM